MVCFHSSLPTSKYMARPVSDKVQQVLLLLLLSIFFYYFLSSFHYFLSLFYTRRRPWVESACVFNCSLCQCRRIGEYISLELFYFVSLTSSCSLIPESNTDEEGSALAASASVRRELASCCCIPSTSCGRCVSS